MNEAQRATWDAHYNPIDAAFRKANPQGKDLVKWKYRRYMKDYLSSRRRRGPQCRSCLEVARRDRLEQTPSSFTPATKVFIWASTAGSTSAGCMRKACTRR